jgi:nucleotide-binding universal stress UspA family protein
VACEVLLGHGEAFSEIVEQAEHGSMDVIVMGRRDKSDLMRVMLGGTTAKVIGHTHSDVLVVPRGARLEGKGIVLPVDGSRHSDAAATTVVSLVKQCKVPVTVVSVAADERLQDDARKQSQRVKDLLEKSGVAAESQVRIGLPDEAIVATARERGADLIVMGSHGRSGLERLLVGSVSERVIGRAECPVLVVKL